MQYLPVPTANDKMTAALIASLQQPKEFKKTAVQPTVFYAFSSALFSLSALFGLFAGFFFPQNAVGEALAGRETLFRGSILGVIVEVFRKSVAAPSLSAAGFSLLPALLYVSVFGMALGIAVSLFLTVLALLFPSRAKPLSYLNGFAVLFAYGAPLILACLVSGYETKAFSFGKTDLSCLAAVSLSALWLFVMACRKSGGFAAANLGLLLLSALSFSALLRPDTALFSGMDAVLSGESGLDFSEQLWMCLMAATTVLNLFAGIFRLGAKNGYPLDILRFGVQSLCAFAWVVCSFLFSGSHGVLTDHPLVFSVLLAAPFGAFLLSAVTAAFVSHRKNEARNAA